MARVCTCLRLIGAVCSFFFFGIGAVLVSRTLANHGDDGENSNRASYDEIVYSEDVLQRFVKALNIRTVTFEPKNYRKDELLKLIKYIAASYPTVHSSPLVKREIVNELSLLYHVEGRNQSLKPYILSAHLDVVPADEKQWEQPPFSGEITDGFVYGRGSIDAKDIVLGILEALEHLLKKGFTPKRSFYLCFGHDEEGGGVDGAKHISQLLHSRGVKVEFLLDEGTFVMNNLVPGVNVPTAMIGVTEKGSLNLLLTVKGKPGHSSIPPRENAIVILGKAVSKLVGDAFPSMLGRGTENEFFKAVGKCASFPFKLVYSNLWLFNGVIAWVMGKSPEMSALMKTTVAVTKIHGGTKENVLPSEANAVVNIRIHPAQTVEEALEFIRQLISDKRVDIKVLSSFPPHPVSPVSESSFGFMVIKQTVKQIFPDSCVAPVTLVGNTDSRWYLNLTNSVYRFSPVTLKPSELSRFHGHNEKIAITNYIELINFYLNLIKNADADDVYRKQKHKHEL